MWHVVRVTEESERKDVDVYVDWEGFADPTPIVKFLENYIEVHNWNQFPQWKRDIMLHFLMETDVDYTKLSEEETVYLHTSLGAIEYVFGSQRTAWMSKDH